MRTLIFILLFPSLATPQWLSVYSATNVIHPEYAEVLDSQYAVLPYAERGLPNYRYLKFNAKPLNVTDTFNLHVHGILPKSADFQIAVQALGPADSTSFYILYSHTPVIVDNEQGTFDSVLTIKLPSFKYSYPFERVAIIRSWNIQDRSHEDALIDGVYLEFPSVTNDENPRDTLLSVHKRKFRRLIRQVEPYDVRGAHVDTLRAPWWIEHDSATGLKIIKIRKP